MFRRKDFLGIEYLVIFSVLFFILLLQSIGELSSYHMDTPRIYTFKNAKYVITPLQKFYGLLFIFLVFFLSTLFSIYKKCTTRLRAEKKYFKEELILSLKKMSIVSLKYIFYSILFFGSLALFIGGIFYLLFMVFAE